MISDFQTNTVYFSNLLPEEFPEEFSDFSALIKDAGYKVKLLVGTEDFFCRDYMPVQVSGTDFVQFVFRPEAYLKGDEKRFLTDPMYVQLMNPGLIKPRYSPIILDGGNIIKGEGKAIITDRVLKDNRYQFSSDEALIERLEFDLKCEVIIIPEYPNEGTGHADGLLRFINENTVFINDSKTEMQKKWLLELLKVFEENNLKFIDLPCEVDEKMDTAEGLYINYLQVGQLIVVSQFGFDADDQALEIITKAFPASKVLPFKANWMAKEGGVFNCMSWGVKL